MTAFPAADDNRSTRAPMPYRGDVDGLRGLAVLAVVLHAFGAPLPGGYAGIDMLLVLSGFLLAETLWRERDATGQIRARAFLARRIGRVGPALLLMLAGVGALGWALLLPAELRALGLWATASVTMLSNILHWATGQPFGGGALPTPLLHTWLIALTAQMTLLLTLVMAALAMRPARIVAVLVALWALSLAASVLATPVAQQATLLLTPFRAWEFLSGALLAIWGQQRGAAWRGPAVLSWVGAGLLLGIVAAMPMGPFFPGLLALLPVAGTLLLIAAGTGPGLVNRALCHPATHLAGRIAFALYLWHWPVLTFGQALRGGALNPAWAALFITLALGLSWLTWHWVEGPLLRRGPLHRRVLPAGALVAGLSVALLGGAIAAGDGLPGRLDAETRMHAAALADGPDLSRCMVPGGGPLMGQTVCAVGPEGQPRVLVWGDEQAQALLPGLEAAASQAGTPGLVVWRAGCPPLFGLRKTESGRDLLEDTACTAANTQIRQSLVRLDNLDSVLLAGRWSYYASGQGIGLDSTRHIAVHHVDETRNTLSQAALVIGSARETVALLRQRVGMVQVLRQVPEIPMHDSRMAAREAAHLGWPLATRPATQSDVPRDALALRAALADAPWRPLAKMGTIRLLDPWPLLCDAATCHATRDGTSLYHDNARLTASGARALAPLLLPVFALPEGTRQALTGTSQP
ncbi:acyltransferase family protein [Thetidibacter halocola]|uniref:Acyltransferase n=1 Tax=Thetidibacter halocola TaxID=2827239 RepID=A0A8J8B8P8_9RHOB|nr:acyltransferase family protein [Thetidibacter halocola]MBS0123378.1 acyltransferase [Thetidibacter halocola]